MHSIILGLSDYVYGEVVCTAAANATMIDSHRSRGSHLRTASGTVCDLDQNGIKRHNFSTDQTIKRLPIKIKSALEAIKNYTMRIIRIWGTRKRARARPHPLPYRKR